MTIKELYELAKEQAKEDDVYSLCGHVRTGQKETGRKPCKS